MKIVLLGTGTPTPSLKRKSSGYLVEVGKDVILLDCGPGSYHRMLEAGKKPTGITDLFLTHLHYDHCLDYITLLLTRWDQGGGLINELNIYGPPPIEEMTEHLIGENGAFSPDLRARTKHPASIDIFEKRGGIPPRKWPKPRCHELEPNVTVQKDGWSITTGKVSHVQPYLNSLAYRIDTEEGSLVYSGDSGPSEHLVELAKNCNVLIHMCHYISGTEPSPHYINACGGHREVAEAAAKAKVKILVLTHMLNQMDVPGVREKILKEMGDIYGGTIIWGEDLMEIPLEPWSPAAYD